MPKQQERVLIAGGGIGGLAAAIALARRGIASEVLERSRFSEETGAGIQLGPNATRALAALGVLEAIGARAFKPEAIAIYDGLTGRKLTSLPLGKSVEDRYGAPYLTLHRADLHAGLRAAAESLAQVTLRPGFEVSAVDTQAADISVRGIDGSEANGAALVGADGLWSAVRPLIAPAASLRFTGATAWRTLLPRAELPAPFNASEVGLWLGPRAHLVHYPVRGGADLNVVAVTEGGAALQGWNQTGSAETLLAGFTGWSQGFEIIAGTRGGLAQLVALWADRFAALQRRPRRPSRRCRPSSLALSRARRRPGHRRCRSPWRRRSRPGPATRRGPFAATQNSAGRAPPASSASPVASAGSIISAGSCGLHAILCSNGEAGLPPSPISTGSTARRAERLRLELPSLFEMPLDRRQGVRRELLQRLVFASLGIFVEQVRGVFVRLDLLLDVEMCRTPRASPRSEHLSMPCCFW